MTDEGDLMASRSGGFRTTALKMNNRGAVAGPFGDVRPFSGGEKAARKVRNRMARQSRRKNRV